MDTHPPATSQHRYRLHPPRQSQRHRRHPPSSCLKKQDAVFASRPDSDGYLTLALSPAGDQWKKMRKVLVSEVLSVRMQRDATKPITSIVRYIYEQCQNPLKNGTVDVKEAAQHYCGNLIRELVFSERLFGPGTEDGGPGLEEREHVAGLFTILKFLYGFAIADFLPWLEVFDFDWHKKIISDAIKSVRKYQDPRIMKRIQMWQHGVIKEEEDNVIDHLLINLKNSENKPLLSPQEIKALILEIMIETVDNPSNALEWAIAEMINQPDILVMACEKLDRVVGKKRLVQESDLPKLNYMKASIPKGSYVVLSRLGLGQNPMIWDEPLRFKSEHHLIDEIAELVLTDHELKMLSFNYWVIRY